MHRLLLLPSLLGITCAAQAEPPRATDEDRTAQHDTKTDKAAEKASLTDALSPGMPALNEILVACLGDQELA